MAPHGAGATTTTGGLGDGTTTYYGTTPVQVGTASNWASISAAGIHTCGTRTDGTAWCWGDNEHGQLGSGANFRSNTPIQVGTATDWAAVDAGSAHTLGIRA